MNIIVVALVASLVAFAVRALAGSELKWLHIWLIAHGCPLWVLKPFGLCASCTAFWLAVLCYVHTSPIFPFAGLAGFVDMTMSVFAAYGLTYIISTYVD